MRLKRRTYLNPQKKTFDVPLLTTVIILVILGLVIVYDVSVAHAYLDFGDSYYYIRQQLIWVLLGLIIGLFFVNFDYHNLKKFAWIGLISSFALLLAVFIPGLGTSSGGAQRWLNLGFATLQPVEVFKLSAVVWLSTMFEKKAKLITLFVLISTAGVIMAVLQKDLGSTTVFGATAVVIYIVSGGSILKILASIPIALVGFLTLILTSDYRQKRFLAFLDPFSEPQGFTYHISQVLLALGSGGLFGLGLGQSRQKFYIPEVTTDSIFAVIGEELGFIGGVFILVLFAIFIMRGMHIASNASDNFGKILSAGITGWLGIQAIVNLGAMVAFLPLTGVPLPFISYGGSALVINLAAVGILLNVSRNSK